MSRPSNSARVGPEAHRGDAFPRSVGQGALRSRALSPLLAPYVTPLTSRCSCRNPCVTSALCLRENNNSGAKTNSLADLFFDFLSKRLAEVVRSAPPPATSRAKQVAQDVSCESSPNRPCMQRNKPRALVCKACMRAERRGAEPRESFFFSFIFFLPACCRSPRVPVTQDRLQVHQRTPASSAEGTRVHSDRGKVSRAGGGLLLLLLLRRHRHRRHLRRAYALQSPRLASFFVAFGERRHAECCGCASERGRV